MLAVPLTGDNLSSGESGFNYPDSLTMDQGLERASLRRIVIIERLKSSQVALKEFIDTWEKRKV